MKGTLEELKQAETDLNEGKKQLKDASKSAAKECEQLNEVLVVPQVKPFMNLSSIVSACM